MDWRVDSVIEIRACMVEDFSLWIEYLKMFQIYIEAMIHSFFNYFTKIRKNRNINCPLTVFVKSRVCLKDRGNPGSF